MDSNTAQVLTSLILFGSATAIWIAHLRYRPAKDKTPRRTRKHAVETGAPVVVANDLVDLKLPDGSIVQGRPTSPSSPPPPEGREYEIPAARVSFTE